MIVMSASVLRYMGEMTDLLQVKPSRSMNSLLREWLHKIVDRLQRDREIVLNAADVYSLEMRTLRRLFLLHMGFSPATANQSKSAQTADSKERVSVGSSGLGA